MSSRALRRLQKEQIPDIVLKKNKESDEEIVESEEEDNVQNKTIKQINPFDLVKYILQYLNLLNIYQLISLMETTMMF
jgi:hypothetical protein